VSARFLYRAIRARYRDQAAELAAARSVLAEGDVAVDVGAHKGAYVYWLRRAVGRSGRVLAFEPQRALAASLSEEAARLRWSNVIVRDCAISDKEGTGTLHVPGQGDSQGASLEEAILGAASCRDVPCPTDTLDHQLEGAGPVALVKVDVEGHELAVFRGARRTLSEDSPVLLFECEARHLTKHTMEDVFGFLEGLGYSGSFFAPEGLLPVSRFVAAVHQRRTAGRFWKAPGYCNNFLFRRAG